MIPSKAADVDLKPSLRASAESRATILNQLAEGVIVTDAQGRIAVVNGAAEAIHGVARLDVEPDDYSKSYHLLHLRTAFPMPRTTCH